MTTYAALTIFPVSFQASGSGLLANGSLVVRDAVSDALTNVYTDTSGTSAGNTITLNSRGEPTVSNNVVNLYGINGASYKFTLFDAGGSQIWSVDNVLCGSSTGQYDMTEAEFKASTILVAGDVVTLSDRAGGTFDIASGTSGANGYNVIANTAGTLKATLRSAGTIDPIAWGAAGDDGEDDTAVIQAIFTELNTNGGKLVSSPDKVYLVTSEVTLLRSSSGHARNWEIDFQGSKIRGTQTSGNILSLGATSESYISDTGKLKLKNLEIEGPETGNGTTDTPDGATTGLNLQFCLFLEMQNVFVRKCYRGIKEEFVFPLISHQIYIDKCYIGLHATDASNAQQWNNPQVTNCRHAYVIQANVSSATKYSINNIEFNTPRVENCLVGFHLDPGNAASTEQIRGVTINDPYMAQTTYDLIRAGKAFAVGTYATRGADVIGEVYGLNVASGHWSYTYSAGVTAPLVVSSTGTVKGTHIVAPWLHEHIEGALTDPFILLTTSATPSYSSVRTSQMLIGGDAPAQGSERVHVEGASTLPVASFYSHNTAGGQVLAMYSDNGGTKVKKWELTASGVHDFRGPTDTASSSVVIGGSAQSVPSQPAGYLEVAVGGSTMYIPYFTPA